MKNDKLQQLDTLVVTNTDIKLPQGFLIKAINTSKETDNDFMREVGQLRYKVWFDQGLDMSNSGDSNSMLDANDDNAIIWAVYHDGIMVGTARLNLFDDLAESPTAYMHSELSCPAPVATLTRLVLLEGCRGKNLGKLFDQIRLQQARILNAKTAFLMCPPWRVAPLERIGYKCLGKATPSKLWPDANWMIMMLDLSRKSLFC